MSNVFDIGTPEPELPGPGKSVSASRADSPVEGVDLDAEMDLAYPQRNTKVVKNKIYPIEDDELILDSDPRGDEKVDSDGNLLGGE